MPLTAFGQTNQLPRIVASNPPPLTVSLPPHVVSVSKQITVFAQDQGFAAGLATFADKVKGRLLTKLALRDEWRTPVLIVIRSQTNAPAGGTPIDSVIYRTDNGLKYQINASVPPPLNVEAFIRELVKVLCLEFANRARAPQAAQIAVPPLWFTEGMTQHLLGNVRSLELELVERAMQTPQGAGLKTIFTVEQLPPSGIELELFKAKCKLLVRSLFLLRDSPHRAQRFLGALQPGSSWREAFEAAYGDELGDASTAEIWWDTQLKHRSAPSPFHRLTAQETDEKLMKVLAMEAIHRDPKTGQQVTRKVAWADLRGYLDKPGTIAMIEDRIRQLESLELIAHQSYIPVIELYLEAFNHVRLDRFRKLRGTLDQAQAALKTTRQQNAEITASLDRMEAAQMNRDLLFLYRDYFQTFDEMKSIEKTRDNAIKDYLDRFQTNNAALKPQE